jgi:acetyl esterase/lipase
VGRIAGVLGGAAAAVGALGVAAAVGARRPVITRWPLSIGQVAPCLPASEAPGPTGAVFGTVGLAALATRTPLGCAAAALNAVAAAGIAGMRGDAERSAAVLDDALLQLGGDPDELPPAEPVPPLARRLREWRTAPARYRVAVDVPYGELPVQLLDIWADPSIRRSGGRGAPVLLQVHGGGWVMGNKDQQGIPLMLHMAARGWVCVAVNYPLSPRARWPEHLVAIKRALQWIRTSSHEYGADPSFVAVTGGSAGGHLAAMVGLTGEDKSLQPGFEDVDTSVQACVPHYGVYDFTDESGAKYARQRLNSLVRPYVMSAGAAYPDEYRAASPLYRITPAAPPFLVVHGSNDTLVPVAEARAFVERLRATAKSPVAYAEIAGAQHAFDIFTSFRSAGVVRGVARFLEWCHATRDARPTGAVPA